MQKLMRAFAVMMAVMLAVFMVACGDDDDDDDDDDTVTVNFVSANPAGGSTIAGNAQITLTFDNPPTNVTVNGTPATVAGKTATWAGNIPAGAATLNVTWDGGSTTLNYTVTAPDTVAPTISSGSVEDGDQDVDPAGLNDGGIEIKFSEAVQKGTAAIATEAGDALNWLADWAADTVTLTKGAAGKDLGNETTYVITLNVKDLAGNALAQTEVTFVTKAKE
jgi:uncharacterized Zn-binding protein involved in type VI secretion